MTYEEAKQQARTQAEEFGFDYGVEKLGDSYRCFMLPQRKNRCGHELRCEVVSCSNIDRTKPGHGYA